MHAVEIPDRDGRALEIGGNGFGPALAMNRHASAIGPLGSGGGSSWITWPRARARA
jgi:hypothetical protein